MAKLVIPADEAKELVLARLATGMKVADAMRSVGRAEETYRDWRKNDARFREEVAKVRENLKLGQVAKNVVPDFPEFAARYLHQPLPLHQLRAWDVISGRAPREVHPTMEFQPGTEGAEQVIINFPPNHGKSTTWSMNWVTWLIHRNPTIRIIIVSKTQRLAKDFLLGVKQRLTNPKFREMHAAFAPDGGWRSTDKSDGLSWREDRIYVVGRNPSEPNPTVQALGIGGQIYGTRAEIVILDDVEDFGNYTQHEQHADWIAREVASRLEPEKPGEAPGQLLIAGTRIGPMDLYRYLRDNAKTLDDQPTYTYFSQPAILDGESDPNSDNWEVLWPERMSATVIRKKRAMFANPRYFGLVWQQRDVSDNSTFPAGAVDASVDQRRFHGPMSAGALGHRREGMQGLYVVGSWDPASSAGHNAMIVVGTDKQTKHRWVLDVWDKKGAVPRETIQRLKDWTVKYSINEWRIEKNAVQQFITQLPEIRDFLSARGARLVEHQTTGNKWDPDLGVEGTLAPLFLSCVEEIDGKLIPRPDGKGLISLPSKRHNGHVATLAEQLKNWEPENKKMIQDLVMALWFAELGIRRYLRSGISDFTHSRSAYISRGDLRNRTVIRIEDLQQLGLLNAA